MKKLIKSLTLTLCLVFMVFAFSACDEDVKKIAIKEITLSKTEITLYTSNAESSSEEIEISFSPADATTLDVEFFSYNKELIKIEKKENSNFIFVVSAINLNIEEARTTIGVRIKGNTKIQANCVVKVKKIKEQLVAPTNIRYDVESQKIVWDESISCNLEDFNGYEVQVSKEGENEIESIICPTTNSVKLPITNKKTTVKVRTLSQLSEYNSNFSDDYTFKVLDDIKILTHNAGLVQWNIVEGVSGYEYVLNGNVPIICDKEITYYNQVFETAGTYSITVNQRVTNEYDQNNDISCYVFAGKSKTISVTKFETPVLNFESYLTWESVATAEMLPENYELSKLVNGDTYQVVQLSKELFYLPPEDLAVGSHTYRIRAIGNGTTTLSSGYSALKVINKIEKPANLRVEDGIITWDRASTAIGYHLTISGLFNGTNLSQVIYINQPAQAQTKVQYPLGKEFSGEYRIKVACVSNLQDTLKSANTEEIVVTKLSTPEKASFSLQNNVIEWAEQTNANGYKIILNDTVEKEVSTNSYTLDEDLMAGNLSIKVRALGSSSIISGKYYLNGEFSQNVYAQKLETPTISVKNGVLVWNKPNNALSLVLSINNGVDINEEINVGTLTSFDFIDINPDIFGTITHFDAGNYCIKIKAIGGNANNLIGTFDSDYSEDLLIAKRIAPTIKLEEGVIKIESSEEGVSNFEKISKNNTDGSITYSCYASGDSTKYLRSDLSNEITVISRTNIVNFAMSNGILTWDAIGDKYEGATYEMKLDGKVVDEITTQTSKEFNDIEAGQHIVTIKVIGTTSGINEKLVLTNTKTDSFTFAKLDCPEISVVSAESVIKSQKINKDRLPGTITWTDVSGALGYKIKIKNTLAGIDDELDIAENYFVLSDYDNGTYTITVKAYGNKTNIINGEYSEEKQVTKLLTPTNLSISNDGTISWNSTYTSGFVNVRAIYILKINGEYYTFYDFSKVLTDTNLLKATSCNFNKLVSLNDFSKTVKFENGTYSVSLMTIPLNLKNYIQKNIPMLASFVGEKNLYDSDSMSNETNAVTFTKLEQPYGLRVDRNSSGDYIASWTNSLQEEVDHYRISITEQSEETPIEIDLEKDITSFNLTEYLSSKTVSNYYVSVKAIATKANYVSSDWGEEVLVKMLDHFSITIKDGELNWSQVLGAQKYQFTFKNLDNNNVIEKEFEPDITNYQMSLNDDEDFIAGNYNIKVKVIGNETSERNGFIYLDTFAEKDFGNFKKLSTPTDLRVNKGIINYQCLDIPHNFNLYFTGDKTETIDNGTNLEYELSDKFDKGNYSLTVQALGSTVYINSEISDKINPETVKKLPAPIIKIEEGLLKWSSVDNSNGYLIRISGARFYVYDENHYVEDTSSQHFEFSVNGVNSIDLSKELTNIENKKFKLASGEYSVEVKALGTNLTYLNSNFSSKCIVKKLKMIEELHIEDGKLVWNEIMTADAPNGINLYVKIGENQNYESPILLSDTTNNSFEFADLKYSEKSLSVYLQIIGDISTNASGSINGEPSEIITFEKLETPSNTTVISTTEQNCFGRFTFDDCSIADVKNEVKIIATTDDLSKEFVYTDLTNNYFDLNEDNFEGITIKENTKFDIYVRYLGGDDYINSDYSEVLSILIPEMPTIQTVMDGNRFTGKVVWNKINVGDLNVSYIVYIQYISLDDANTNSISSVEQITEEVWDSLGGEKTPYETDKNYYYVYGKGYYRFSIVSVLKIENSENLIKSNETDYTETVIYRIFEYGSGEIENPFIVDSVDSFNAIYYNLSAHYKLSQDISFKNKTIHSIGLEEEMFTGSFDGDNKVLSDITLLDVAVSNSIFNYVGVGGIVRNVKVENLTISNGTYVGGIAGYNNGLIENVIIGNELTNDCSISPISTSSNTTYVGGVVGKNLGTVKNCMNYLTIAPKNARAEVVSGGIVGINKGAIQNCTNYGTVGGTGISSSEIASNYSGGIVGFNGFTGENDKDRIGNTSVSVLNCKNFGNVYAQSRNTNSVSQAGYAGGVVGYNNAGTIEQCSNDNSNGIYTEEGIQSVTQIYALTNFSENGIYVGGIVGRNYVGSKLINCYTISNIKYEKSGTSANINIGDIVGENSVTSRPDLNFNTIYCYALSTSLATSFGSGMPITEIELYRFSQANSGEMALFKNRLQTNLSITLE